MKKLRFVTVSLLILMLLASAAGCGTSGGTPASPSASAQPSSPASPASSDSSNAVVMKNSTFKPAEITIKIGETITWTNEDASTHDVAGDSFKSGSMKKGSTFSFTFNEAGTFNYICTYHSGMNGKVIVE